MRAGLLPEAYIAPRELRDLRELLRHRATLTRMRSAGVDRHRSVLWLALALATLALVALRWRGLLAVVGVGLSLLLVEDVVAAVRISWAVALACPRRLLMRR